jgi:ABC-type transport system involved in Fe-S cluster assembly fused permease/ATPase subunit
MDVTKKEETAKKWSDILTLVSSIGLFAATLPELIKAIKDPKSVEGISLYFLLGRGAFFVVLALSLFILPKQYKTYNTVIIAWLSVWYIIFYIVLLILRFIGKRKKEKSGVKPKKTALLQLA